MRQRSNLITIFGVAFFLVGGALVYLVATENEDRSAASTGGPADVAVFVAAQDIDANTLGSEAIQRGLLTTEHVPAGSQPVGAVTSAGGLDNQIFAVGVAEGEVITAAQLAVRSLSNITVPEGFDGVAVTLPYTNGGAGYIAPGDTVNVYGIYGETDRAAGIAAAEQGHAPLPRTELILTNVRVLDVDDQASASFQTAEEGEEPGPARRTDRSTLTHLLALRPADAERLVHVASFAQLHLGLTADGAAPAGDTPGSDGRTALAPVSAGSAAPVEG